jgi:hypothetical protein
VLASQLPRDRRQIVEDPVATGQAVAQVHRNMPRELAVAPTEQQVAPQAAAPIPVDGEHDIHMLEEPRKHIGVRGVEGRGSDMVAVRWRLQHSIEGGSGTPRDFSRHGIGRSLEVAPVVGHDPEAAPKLAELRDLVSRQELPQHGQPSSSP